MPAFDRPSGSQGISFQDFARERNESEWPSLWDGMQGFWCPGLGRTGLVLANVAPGIQDMDRFAAFRNLTASAWVPMPEDGRPGIEFFNNNSAGSITAGIPGHIHDEGNGITFGCYVFLDPTRGSVADFRLMSRSRGTSAPHHKYMMGSQNGVNFRSRVSISGTTVTDISIGTFLLAGETHLYAVTHDGADIKHWRDAINIGTFARAGTVTPNDDTDGGLGLSLGANFATGGTYGTFDGTAYCFFVYNRVLQPWELELLAAIPDAPLRPRPTMVSAFVPAAPAITPGEIVAAATSFDNRPFKPDTIFVPF